MVTLFSRWKGLAAWEVSHWAALIQVCLLLLGLDLRLHGQDSRLLADRTMSEFPRGKFFFTKGNITEQSSTLALALKHICWRKKKNRLICWAQRKSMERWTCWGQGPCCFRWNQWQWSYSGSPPRGSRLSLSYITLNFSQTICRDFNSSKRWQFLNMAHQQLIKTPDSVANHCLQVTGERRRAVCHSDCGNAAHSSRLGFPDSMMSHHLVSLTSSRPATATGEAARRAWKKTSISTLILPDSLRAEASPSWCLHVNMTLRSRLNKLKEIPGIFRRGCAREFKAINWGLNKISLLQIEHFKCSCTIYRFQLDFSICSFYLSSHTDEILQEEFSNKQTNKQTTSLTLFEWK